MRTTSDGEPRTATSTFTQLLSSECQQNNAALYIFFLPRVQCCFTSTETIRLIRDGEPSTATSTFTQLLISVWHYTNVAHLKELIQPTTSIALSLATRLDTYFSMEKTFASDHRKTPHSLIGAACKTGRSYCASALSYY